MSDSLKKARREYRDALRLWAATIQFPGRSLRLGRTPQSVGKEADAALERLESAARLAGRVEQAEHSIVMFYGWSGFGALIERLKEERDRLRREEGGSK